MTNNQLIRALFAIAIPVTAMPSILGVLSKQGDYIAIVVFWLWMVTVAVYVWSKTRPKTIKHPSAVQARIQAGLKRARQQNGG